MHKLVRKHRSCEQCQEDGAGAKISPILQSFPNRFIARTVPQRKFISLQRRDTPVRMRRDSRVVGVSARNRIASHCVDNRAAE
jgi:hypothetical protein